MCTIAYTMPVRFRVNTTPIEVEPPDDDDPPLLYILRNDLGLKGTRFGCGMGVCGACTVLLDGRPITSCDTPLSAAVDRDVTTVEGLAAADRLSDLQAAFLEEQAGQCGYCLSGVLLTAAALLAADPHPTREAIRAALDRTMCRCGAQQRFVRAIERASDAAGAAVR